ncbi:MaoC family dehydratase [Dactylosporangium fulvum]|uniref:MaoC/PaaZ C-terminal domain-containing protein n=1 Tax=Dactylosporangium fulvum TaxID=53359 RepID=A0ABY5VPS9_9ACTN|nr:MaoC/PaaZ C-terminal domain-containing protein [Dactylosporangium fulvum]UWP79762.1 MaoC/PaaZ C-terminal domain-containing protein [Dactylosporangium fulvum]
MTAVSVGEELGPLVTGPVTRQLLALFAGASGDRNPLHIDIDYARAAGRDDVIAHGMLSMAWLSRLVVERFGPESLTSLQVRFLSPTPVHAVVHCRGVVTAVGEQTTGTAVQLDLWTDLDDGTTTLRGSATCLVGRTRREERDK